MPNQIKTRGPAKRKLDPEIQGKGNKAKKENVTSEKGEMVSKFKDLKAKYESLEFENTQNIELIIKLKKELLSLKEEKLYKKVLVTTITQTGDDDDFEIPCKECIFMASCEDELRWHMTTSHEHPKPDHYDKISCKDCGKGFYSKGEIMTHRKEVHPNLIKACSYFLEGKCSFEESDCWYSHKRTKSTVEKEFQCRFCEKIFKRKHEFMIHRKNEHKNVIPTCREHQNGTCRFTTIECWYKHEENLKNYEHEEINMIYPNNLNLRIFNMMEQVTERLEMIEETLDHQNK